jgi:hypothetical protein
VKRLIQWYREHTVLRKFWCHFGRDSRVWVMARSKASADRKCYNMVHEYPWGIEDLLDQEEVA